MADGFLSLSFWSDVAVTAGRSVPIAGRLAEFVRDEDAGFSELRLSIL